MYITTHNCDDHSCLYIRFSSSTKCSTVHHFIFLRPKASFEDISLYISTFLHMAAFIADGDYIFEEKETKKEISRQQKLSQPSTFPAGIPPSAKLQSHYRLYWRLYALCLLIRFPWFRQHIRLVWSCHGLGDSQKCQPWLDQIFEICLPEAYHYYHYYRPCATFSRTKATRNAVIVYKFLSLISTVPCSLDGLSCATFRVQFNWRFK